jgi:hypothetical protein
VARAGALYPSQRAVWWQRALPVAPCRGLGRCCQRPGAWARCAPSRQLWWLGGSCLRCKACVRARHWLRLLGGAGRCWPLQVIRRQGAAATAVTTAAVAADVMQRRQLHPAHPRCCACCMLLRRNAAGRCLLLPPWWVISETPAGRERCSVQGASSDAWAAARLLSDSTHEYGRDAAAVWRGACCKRRRGGGAAACCCQSC